MPTTVNFVSPHNGWKGTQQSTFTGEQLQGRNTQWLLTQWECTNPNYHTPQIRNTAMKQIWGPLLQELRSRPCPWQGNDNHTAKVRTHSVSRASSCHHNTSQTPIKGIMAQVSGPTSPTRGKTPEARGIMILQPAERRPQTQQVRQNEMTKKYVANEGARLKIYKNN